jgi:hypothetical protein
MRRYVQGAMNNVDYGILQDVLFELILLCCRDARPRRRFTDLFLNAARTNQVPVEARFNLLRLADASITTKESSFRALFVCACE